MTATARSLLHIVAAMALLAPVLWAQPRETPAGDIRVTVDFRNGAHIEGVLLDATRSLTLHTAFGDLEIPFDEVLAITRTDEPEGHTVVRTPSGEWPGRLAPDAILGRVDTGFGVVEVPAGEVRRLTAYSQSALLLGLKGLWTFEDGARDTSPSGVHGKLMNGARVTDDPDRGRVLALDGKDDYVHVGNPEELQISGALTIAMWIKPSRLGQRVNPYGKAYSGEGTMTLEGNGTINFYYGPTGNNGSPYQGFTTRTPIVPGRWTHIAVVRDPDTMTLSWYLDGRLDHRQPMSYPKAGIGSLDVTIGDDYVQPVPGLLDDVAVFARALDEAAVKRLRDADLRD